jgi:hypothetical protein
MDGYRISKSRDEIVKVLQKKFEAENSLTLWQKDSKTGERRFKCEVKFSDLNISEGFFSVKINNQDLEFFNPQVETYFLLTVQDFVFKTKISNVKSEFLNTLNFQIPYDVCLKEMRAHPRTYINQDEKRLVSAKFFSNNKKKKEINVACPIYNISMSGICIIISKETLSSIKLNEEIHLEGLSFFDSLQNAKKAIVRNARLYCQKGLTTDEFYAIGLEFQN